MGRRGRENTAFKSRRLDGTQVLVAGDSLFSMSSTESEMRVEALMQSQRSGLSHLRARIVIVNRSFPLTPFILGSQNITALRKNNNITWVVFISVAYHHFPKAVAFKGKKENKKEKEI